MVGRQVQRGARVVWLGCDLLPQEFLWLDGVVVVVLWWWL
jgi:hypothetical protein